MAGEIHYVDGVGRMSVMNGHAYVDLVTAVPPVEEGGQMSVAVTHRLALALPQFVRMCAEMANQLKLMEDKGLITRQPAAAS